MLDALNLAARCAITHFEKQHIRIEEFRMSNITVDANHRKLYSPTSFPILAALFSFLLPGVLYSLNLGKFGRTGERNKIIVLSLLGEAALSFSSDLFAAIPSTNSETAF